MKKTSILFIAISAIALMSWTGYNMMDKEVKSYKLDQTSSKLIWTGKYVSDGHTHTGTVNITNGDLQVSADNSISGTFTVDMNSIVCTDLPEAKKGYLVGHLTGEDFFNTKKFSDVLVKVQSMNDKEISVSLSVMGKEIPAIIPIKVNKTQNSFEAKGQFEIDFSTLNMPGTKAAKGKPENERTDSKISFDLTLNMKG